MESKKSTIIITILLLLLVLLAGYLICDKTKSEELKNESIKKSSVKEEQIAEWMNYLINSNIESIELEKNIIDNAKNNQKVNLTKDELKELFTTLNKFSVNKTYASGAGCADGNKLTINYKVDDKNYKFFLCNSQFILDGNDKKLTELVRKMDLSKVVNEELSTSENVIEIYTYETDIYEKYFNKKGK